MTDVDLAAEVSDLKKTLATLMASKSETELTTTSVWVVFDATRTGVWCSKTDCPKLARDISFDVAEEVQTDDGLEAVIKTGLSEEEAESYENRKKRIGSPTIKHHDLGVIASFSTEKKATKFIKHYFKVNQRRFEQMNRDGIPTPDICLSEVVINE
tara:strand:- start:2188 stop:2655 length:468 start_codon:yes stop_codon:yes gene_type:complete